MVRRIKLCRETWSERETEELLNIHAVALKQASKLMGNRCLLGKDAEDIAGDSVLALLKSTQLSKMRPPLSARVVRCQWINVLRRDAVRQRNEGHDRARVEERLKHSTPYISILDERRLRRLRHFIEIHLEPDQAQAVIRCSLEGESSRTLARELGCCQRAIQCRRKKGRSRLKALRNEMAEFLGYSSECLDEIRRRCASTR